MTFGQELIVMHTRPSTFGGLLVHAGRHFKNISSQFIEGQARCGMP